MVFDKEFMRPYFDLLLRTKGIEQDEQHHPEGDVFIHSMQVLGHALREATNVDVVFASMLHDVGKIENTLGHEKIGADMIKDLASAKVLWLVENHLRGRLYISGEMKRVGKCRELVDHPWFPELVQVMRFDKMGRRKGFVPSYDEDKILDRINHIAKGQFDNV